MCLTGHSVIFTVFIRDVRSYAVSPGDAHHHYRFLVIKQDAIFLQYIKDIGYRISLALSKLDTSVSKKVKLSRYWPGQALGFPGG
jgi:hypothetical protein